MCGIIGYIGEKEVLPILIEGLKKLEYRGYDSAGISIISENKTKLIKAKGRIFELEEKLKNLSLHGCVGLGHTRWATHGEPNEINSHPHKDCSKKISIVHNGIIENYQSLKKLLIDEGHIILSETDSEILAHLIEKFYEGNLEEAVRKTIKIIEGAYGLCVIHEDCPDEIICARKSSPLVLGIGEGEMFVASDIPAIIKHTNKIIYLNDNEIVKLKKDSYSIKKINGEKMDPKIHDIKWTLEEIEKGNFKHFMLKEIFEQPKVLLNTLRGRIKDSKMLISLKFDFGKINKIVLIACGTSWHSALIGKYLIESITKIPVEVDYASEYRYRKPIINPDDLVVAISQSGETADTLAAIKLAKQKGAKTMGIVNVVGSSITREVDSGMYLHVGPEIGVASTKAFTSQVLALILFALYIKYKKQEILENSFVEEINTLFPKIEEVLENAEKIKKIALDYGDAKNFLYFGRGINFPVALEGALKLKEISYIHAEGYPAAEMKHGPIALIDENMPVVFIATNSHLDDKILSNLEEIRARKGKIIGLVSKGNSNLDYFFDRKIEVPIISEELSPIINVVALQLLAYYIADSKGLNIDKPRNLAKSVTVE